MTSDPLLTDDLATLLRQFTNSDLYSIVSILKRHTSWSPFPASRATAARAEPVGGNLQQHADAIALEILWWGSNEFHRQVGEERTWLDVVAYTAKSVGVPYKDRTTELPAWRIEGALLTKVLTNWEALSPEQREAALREAGINVNAVRGGFGAAVGAAARLGGPELIALLGEGAAITFAATILAPIAATLGTIWAAYDLAGAGYRVLRPVALLIAFTRQRLRDQRAANIFQD